MAGPSNGITFRTIQEAMPEYHISDDLVRGVLAAMPPPAAGIPYARRQERLARVIDEFAARVPMDAAQGHLAGQLVVVEFLAFEMLERVTTSELPLTERRLASRASDDLIRSITRLEHTLERRQARVMPFRDVGAAGGFDLDALDKVWCRGVPGASATGPVGPAADCAGDAAMGTVPSLATPEPAAGLVAVSTPSAAGHAGGGSGASVGGGTSDGHDRRSRAGVTLEQSDGWSLEVWPARAGIRRRVCPRRAGCVDGHGCEVGRRGGWGCGGSAGTAGGGMSASVETREAAAGTSGRPRRAHWCGARMRVGGWCSVVSGR